jgi:hypothetical protein
VNGSAAGTFRERSFPEKVAAEQDPETWPADLECRLRRCGRFRFGALQRRTGDRERLRRPALRTVLLISRDLV